MTLDAVCTQIKSVDIVAHKVDLMEVGRTGQSASFHLMKDQQSVMNTKLDAIRKDLDNVWYKDLLIISLVLESRLWKIELKKF